MSGAIADRVPLRARRGEPDAVARGGRRDVLIAAVLWAAAAVISGFTIRRYLDPFDEGLLMQAAARIGSGQWPYADFGWPYGPGHPLLIALANQAFGTSVLWWRLVRTASDASIALLAFVLVRREAGSRWGVAAWLAAAVTMAQPTVANPFPVAFALGLGGVLAAARARAAVAGVLAAAAIFWRPDFGLAGLVAAMAALALAGGWRPALRAGAVAIGISIVAYAPFAIAAGPHALWEHLIGISLREGGAWRLPFPLLYDGRLRLWPPGDLLHDGKDVIGYELPLVATIALAVAAAAIAARRVDRARLAVPAGLAILGAFGFFYLVSRADEFHAQPLAVCAAALLAIAGARHRGIVTALAGVLLAFVIVAGVANRVSALVLPPDLRPLHIPGVPGIGVPPAEAAALPKVVADVQRLDPPNRPIYVAPRRSDLVAFTDPLLYVLVRRPSVLDEDASLQARPAEQAAIVRTLERTRPLVVRWTDPLSSRREPNERGRSTGVRTLDDYLARAYRLYARHGAYDVLVRRATP